MQDIRLSLEFFDHPKTEKLRRRLGLEGVISLLKLWIWAAKNRPEGNLSNMDIEDIEIAAEWTGKQGALHNALITLRWLDSDKDDAYRLHDWLDHNEWVADSVMRGDRARFSRMASTYPALYAKLLGEGRTSITRDEYLTLTKLTPVNEASTNDNGASTPSPSPAPSPVPAPVPVPVPSSTGDLSEKQKAAMMDSIIQRARMCLALMPKFANEPPKAEDLSWIVSLYQNVQYKGVNIYNEFVNALKWVNKKNIAIKDTRAFLIEWLEKVHNQRIQG